MKNFVSNGNSLQLIAPVGGVVGGAPYKIGLVVGVVVASAAEGEQFTLQIKGVYNLPKVAAEAWALGVALYLNVAGTAITTTAAGGTAVGYAASAQLAADVFGDVLLDR